MKRKRRGRSGGESPLNSTRNPSSSQSHADLIIASVISFPESSSTSTGFSFDEALDKALTSISSNVSVQDSLVDRTRRLASILLDSTSRCYRKRASVYNSNSWILPPELTIKVFSMLDTKSLMQVAASCTMFNKCAMDSAAYAQIDLTTADKRADNGVLWTMMHRTGKEFRSEKRYLVCGEGDEEELNIIEMMEDEVIEETIEDDEDEEGDFLMDDVDYLF